MWVWGALASIRDHLEQLLKSREFAVDERDGYLYGRREDISIVIMTASDMLLDDVQDFIRNTRGFPGRKVVVSVNKADDSVQAYLQRNRVHYWGREEIEHEIGNLHLETVAGERGKSLIDDIISDEVPQMPVEPHDHSIPVILESSEERSERIVKPNFTLEDMKHLARHDVKGYRYQLELVPHYLFHYVLNLQDGNQRAGIAAVNALTSHVETWRWGFELVDSIDIQSTRQEPKVDYENALKVARDMIEKEFKSHTETVKDYGHTEVIERKRSAKDGIVIEPKGLVYLPVWCVEGASGAMIVNSSSGKIISEHLHGGKDTE